MGNQLVGVAPSQIFPVEHYLTHYPSLNLQFEKNLGSTRFFKVAKALSNEGLVVVKVFVLHDLSLLLQPYQQRIEEIRSKLVSAFNCLPFRKAILENGAAFLVREYVKYSLYDRISTRPFLTPIEKKWIAFQILYALHQCHKVGVCHGDIKLENIMVTSWHWVLLVDFASFKPTRLPDDNPSDFSFFFDTSRRRTCYIAPERFVRSLNPDNNMFLLQENKDEELTPAMDIFSAGCVLAELFSDGRPPFDLSHLLSYRNNPKDEQNLKFLNEIEEPAIKELIKAMINPDPSKRLSAEVYLAQERGRIFPEYFYSFFQSYMLMFSATSPILSPDEKVERLHKDIVNVINMLKTTEAEEREIQKMVKITKAEEKEVQKEGNEENYCEALILITALVTSCVRGLRFSSTKLQVLEIMHQLSNHLAAETILDRIIPYILHLLHDECPRVRVSAIHTISKCLILAEKVPFRDANIFPEYILPALLSIVQDEAVVVRTALAKCIAQLGETSLRFLVHSHKTTAKLEESPRRSYESEIVTLHEMIQQCVSTLLTDSQNVVKRTLIESEIVKLCLFFGKNKCNDVILSHMITFLNDKVDKQLRGSFFDCIDNVVRFVGYLCSPILVPLLEQGFTDSEEFVVRKAINALSALTGLRLLYKPTLYDLVKNTTCFLIHPNLWIRQATVGFLGMLNKSLNSIEILSQSCPIVNKYLERRILQLDKRMYVLNALKSPIPRPIYDMVIRTNNIEFFLQTLRERQKARKEQTDIQNMGYIPSSSLITSPKQFQNLFRRLSSEGMNDVVEDKLLLIEGHLRKLNNYLMHVDLQLKPAERRTVEMDVSSLQHKIKYHSVKFDKSEITKDTHTSISRRRLGTDDNGSHLVGSMNEEWKHMFGNSSTAKHSQHTSDIFDASASKRSDSYLSVENNFDVDSIQERSYIQYRYPPCRTELGKLIRVKQEQYETAILAREWAENEAWLPVLPPPSWKLRSSLVAHLHEHTASVKKLVSIPESGWFASCSADSYIRLWDCSRMENRSIITKSRQSYNTKSGRLNSMTVCRNNQSLASVSDSGAVTVLNMDTGSSKMSVLYSRTLDLEEDGYAVDIAHFDPGSQAVLVYVTMYGTIIGWDLRANKNAWKIKSKTKQGAVTTMCMDSLQSCIILGTACGYHTCIDLRFRLPITSVVHPFSARVRKIIRHPKEASWIISAVQGNNEICVFDMETGNKDLTLWASNTPPLSKPHEDPHSVCALYAYNSDKSPILLAGGTDQRIRKWHFKTNYNDNGNRDDGPVIAIPAASDTFSQQKISYTDRFIEGSRVVQEYVKKSVQKDKGSDADRSSSDVNEQLSAGPEQPSPGHRDMITDITMCQASQCFLVTSAHDGVIKVWK